ncbi:hypothetical protein WR25_24549 [Diploscapter pachys]|uniref:G-protein coupled receptors family 1 profile domain-containing protein n=1 Tax=Diploscapter pachys TaxID=2018661 RepID=A0A2A2JNS0_9BILA|nr:hypothetical protein WR25_24549 [Diploscapter pachys]
MRVPLYCSNEDLSVLVPILDAWPCMSPYEIASIVFHAIVDPISMFFNGLLIYIIIRHSPSEMKEYRILLTSGSLAEFLSAFISFSSIIKEFPTDGAYMFVHYGICKFASSQTCYTSFVLQLNLWAHITLNLLLCFAYRYHSIQRNLSKLVVCGLLLLILAPSTFNFFVGAFSNDDQKAVEEYFIKRYNHYIGPGIVSGSNDL